MWRVFSTDASKLPVLFSLASVLVLGWAMHGVDRMVPDNLNSMGAVEIADQSGYRKDTLRRRAASSIHQPDSKTLSPLNSGDLLDNEPTDEEITFVKIRGSRLRKSLAEQDLLAREVAVRAKVPVDVVERMLWSETSSVSPSTAERLAYALRTSANLLR